MNEVAEGRQARNGVVVHRHTYSSASRHHTEAEQDGAGPPMWAGAASRSQASMRATLRPTLRYNSTPSSAPISLTTAPSACWTEASVS